MAVGSLALHVVSSTLADVRSFIILMATCLVPAFTLRAIGDRADLEVYDSMPAGASHLPAPYSDYVIFPGTTSPDGQYAFIYPNRSVLENLDQPIMYLVALNPFRLVLKMPSLDEFFAANAHGDFDATWAKDSSCVLAIDGGKWGAEKVYLIPIASGRAGEMTDLSSEVAKKVIPDFYPPKYDPTETYFYFVDDSWMMDEHGNVEVSCTCETDPNNVSEPHDWEVTFKGIWDATHHRFISFKATRISGAGDPGLH